MGNTTSPAIDDFSDAHTKEMFSVFEAAAWLCGLDSVRSGDRNNRAKRDKRVKAISKAINAGELLANISREPNYLPKIPTAAIQSLYEETVSPYQRKGLWGPEDEPQKPRHRSKQRAAHEDPNHINPSKTIIRRTDFAQWCESIDQYPAWLFPEGMPEQQEARNENNQNNKRKIGAHQSKLFDLIGALLELHYEKEGVQKMKKAPANSPNGLATKIRTDLKHIGFEGISDKTLKKYLEEIEFPYEQGKAVPAEDLERKHRY